MQKLLVIAALLAALVAAAAAAGCGGAGASSTAFSEEERADLARYRSYLNEQADLTVEWTAKLERQITAGRLAWAQPFYGIARVHYSEVEALARQLEPGLVKQIDAEPDEVPGSPLIGFHRLEKGLLREKTTRGLKADARRLLAAVRLLRDRLERASLDPPQLLHASAALMRLVAAAKLTGRAEPYSQLDLVDVSADVEGAEAAARAARICVGNSRWKEIQRGFEAVYAEVDELGYAAREAEPHDPEAGAGMHAFSELSGSERLALRENISRLARSLSSSPCNS